jgi:DNA-binding NarL/FixJ family response regulator
VNPQVTIALVDDEKLMRDGLRMILESEADLTVVAEAADGEEGVDVVSRVRPDVVLMDLRMPGRDGIWATRQLVGAGVPTSIVVLTTFDQDDNVLDALHAGASGYLLKSTPGDRLIGAVRAAAAGETSLSPSILRRVLDRALDRDHGRREADPVLERLTARELEVLRQIALGATNDEIARSLFITEATVKSHVGRIFAKTGARDRVQAVVLAHRAGLTGP